MKQIIRSFVFSRVKKIIDDEKKAFFFTPFLLFASLLFQTVVFCKNFLYRKKWIVPQKADLPVISIGNIVAGGTGKTPLTIALTETLLNLGFQVGIASRGYLSKHEKKKESLIGCMGNGPLYNSTILGDEPYLLAKRCTKSFISVGKNRFDSCKKLYLLGADVVILDDGMQHQKLFRDIEIVLLHGDKLLGNNKFIPRGYLRDFPQRLKKADIILVNHTNNNDFTRIESYINVYTSTPITFIGPQEENVYSLDDVKQFCIDKVPIGVFCAIANPEPFLRLLKKQGAKIVSSKLGADHSDFTIRDLQNFAKSCKKAGARMLVCTEKDQVKIRRDLGLCLPVGYLKMNMIFSMGKENWTDLLDRIYKIILSRSKKTKV